MGVNGREFFIKKTLEFFKNTSIFFKNTSIFLIDRWHVLIYIDCFKKITVRNDCQAMDFIKFAFVVYLKQKGL